jgi:hypothetical protein
MLLKLTWTLARDKFVTRTVLGEVESIAALYWQLLEPGRFDGTRPGKITITNLDGLEVNPKMPLEQWFSVATSLHYG